MSAWRLLLALAPVAAAAAGCQARIDAYYNAGDNIVARRLLYNDQRHIAVDAGGPVSRPAAAAFDGKTWLAWRHDLTLPSGETIRGIGVGAVPCTLDDAVIFDEPGPAPLSTPGLAVLDGRLALAWCSGDSLKLSTSTDGRSWTPAAVIAAGPLLHVALAAHRGRLFAAVTAAAATGGTVAVLPINDDLTWGQRREVVTGAELAPQRGVSLASDGAHLYLAFAPGPRQAGVYRCATGEGDWVREPAPIGGGEHPAVSGLVPALAWDPSRGRLRAAWTDGSDLWLAEQRDPPQWSRYRCGDVYTPSLQPPGGAALLIGARR